MNISEALNEVNSVVDALGTSIDEPIRYAVAALHVAGIPTSASCGGHMDRGNSSPWIRIGNEIEAPSETETYPEVVGKVDENLQKLLKKYKNVEIYSLVAILDTGKRYDIAIDTEGDSRIRSLDETNLDDTQVEENYNQRQLLMKLLQDFYDKRPKTALDIMLTIEEGGANGECTLQNMGSLTIGRLADSKRAKTLTRYRQEFDDFGKYLVSLQ